MDTTRYLRRIQYEGPVDVSADTLRQLQLAHLHTVPFENLSIHWHEPIVLSNEALFEKIVERKRGGFCYELNGLFGALLRELGFRVDMLSAGVANEHGKFGPDFDHMVLLVTLDEPWVVDVGFGDSFTEPLRLDSSEQTQGTRAYHVRPEAGHLVMSQRNYDGSWARQYRFTLQPHQYTDYEAMCWYHQSSPQSHFTQKRVCTRLSDDGRITLSDLRLITTNKTGIKETRLLADEHEFTEVLRTHFGIHASGRESMSVQCT